MKDFIIEPAPTSMGISALQIEREKAACLDRYAAYVGLDVHKDTISVAVALPGRTAGRFEGEIGNKPKQIEKLVQRLSERFAGQMLLFCYEAGPCGFVLHRQISQLGYDCEVIAPSKIPRKAGEKIKTDRLDAVKLSQYLRAGELSSVWIPGHEQEAMRDLTRARGDMKGQQLKARQQLNAFVLRHGHHWPSNKCRWTKSHYNWLESLTFKHAFQQIVLQEYVDAVKAADARVAEMDRQIEAAVPSWSYAPIVASLMALRGLDRLAAVTLLAELGDISRFESPRQLMAFLGLVPSEHSSGGRRRQGAITLTGNAHARRMLIESAWSYRFPARQTMHLKRKMVGASETAKAISWKAQKRLCGRYRRLVEAGKNTKLVCVAIARELAAFVWDVVRQEMGKIKQASAA